MKTKTETKKYCKTKTKLKLKNKSKRKSHWFHRSLPYVVARLTYAASAWRGLIKAPNRKLIDSVQTVLDRARRHGYCPPDLPTFDELCKNTADDELFSRAICYCLIMSSTHSYLLNLTEI